MTSASRKYFAASVFFASVLALSFCNNKSKKEVEIPKEGTIKILAVYIRPDSTRTLDIVLRQIVKRVRYDSASKRDIIAIDTLWGIPMTVDLVGADGKPIIDSITRKPKINPQVQYILIGKDSVNTHVENISVDSLLKKK